MANYYTNLCVALKLPIEQGQYLMEAFETVDNVIDDQVDATEVPEKFAALIAEVDLDKICGTGTYVGVHPESAEIVQISDDDGCCDVELIALILQHTLKHFDSDQGLGFDWANHCDRHRPDAFGGGACYVTKDAVQWLSTSSWLAERAIKVAA
jgi:hypothetical protein